jgi:pyruvate/2-oxoglutarate dehydrogenase complex dihydrolipoamide acyltransferase (E2) component
METSSYNCVVAPGSDCELKIGSAIRIIDTKPTPEKVEPMSTTPTSAPEVPTAAAPEPVEPAPAPAEPVSAPVPAPAPAPELVETVGVSQDITAAADAAKALGGDYAPMVAIALAGMAVAGGGKAWSFYRERAEQKHEQEMKKLEIEAQNKGMDGQQPPPCAAKSTAMQAEIDGLKSKLGSIEKKTATISADFDGEDVERQMRKMKKRIDELFEMVEK